MSANRVDLDGLDELRQQLRALPENMVDEAGAIVDRRAQNAAASIRSGYPDGPSGNLRKMVTVSIARPSPFATAATVRSNAPHASLFEFGSQARHTQRGANRGRMPAKPTVIPAAIRERRAMNDDLRALVQRAGFVVTGQM